MNISIYLEAKELTTQIFENIRTEEKARIQINIVCVGHFIHIFKYLCSSLPFTRVTSAGAQAQQKGRWRG